VTDDQLIAQLTEAVRTALKQPTLEYQPDRALRDIFGLDSVQFVQMILALETEFDVMLDEDEVDRLERLGDLFNVLRSKVAVSG
jgi:acyl carrier protein